MMGNIFVVHLFLLLSGSSLQLIVYLLISMLESTKLFWVSLNLDSLSISGRFQSFFVESTDSLGLKLNVKTKGKIKLNELAGSNWQNQFIMFCWPCENMAESSLMTRCYRLLSPFLSYCSRKFKTVLDSGFRAMDPGFQLLDFGLFVSKTWIPDSLRCNSRFQSPGSRIPQANFSPIPDFTNKKIPGSGIRILLHKAALATDCAPRERLLNS